MDNVTEQLLKITGNDRYPEDWPEGPECPEGPWQGPEGECYAVLSIGEALFGAYLEARHEIREAENDPLEATSERRDRYYEILSLTAKYAVRRNLDNDFLASTIPELREPIARAIAFERGINYARVLATYYSELATRWEQEPEQDEGDE